MRRVMGALAAACCVATACSGGGSKPAKSSDAPSVTTSAAASTASGGGTSDAPPGRPYADWPTFGANATVQVRRTIPTPGGHPEFQQQRPALAVADGRVYIEFGGLAGDCGTYLGSIVAASDDGKGDLLSYAVPTKNRGAIWAPPGPV